MNGTTSALDVLAQLRHALRTTLNHVIGYADMFREDTEEADAKACHSLRSLIAEAHSICDLLQNQRPASSPVAVDMELETLRSGMRRHILAMSSSLCELQGFDKPDLARIGTAIQELNNFVETGHLPFLAETPVRTAPENSPATLQRSARFLVVDDDEGNRDILQRHLERQGYQVEQAASGEYALGLLRSSSFDAVLLDLVMPGMNGLQVLRALKTDEVLRELPVLVISASDELTLVADSIKGGAEDYLSKPFDPVLLRARLTATLERKSLRDQERSRSAELEEVTRALRRSNEDLRCFAYAASHDLQAPVRTINTYLQLLQRRLGAKLTREDCEAIDFARDAADRMGSLIQDLLQYSNVNKDIRPETLDTDALLSAVIYDLRVLIDEAKASVTAAPLPNLFFDRTSFRQLLQNLIGNAIKYRRDEPLEVHVSAVLENGHCRFLVQDNGQGIAPEHHKQIFEMFNRLHGFEVPGSGIGLATCQRIVERVGGRIWVDSIPGQGSTFFFTIPCEKQGRT